MGIEYKTDVKHILYKNSDNDNSVVKEKEDENLLENDVVITNVKPIVKSNKLYLYKYIFIFASVGLTFISLNAGFDIYEQLFNLRIAILISTIFELLRLTCLYSMNHFNNMYKMISIVLYIIIGGVCFLAAVLSFNSKVIENNDNRQAQIQKDMNKDIYVIKKTYSDKIDLKLNNLKSLLEKAQKGLANNQKSKYYVERIEQIQNDIEKVNKEREDYLNSVYDVKEQSQWIQNQKAMLGIENLNDVYNKKSSPFSRAIYETLGVDEILIQKIIGFILSFAIESGIILLALMALTFQKKLE